MAAVPLVYTLFPSFIESFQGAQVQKSRTISISRGIYVGIRINLIEIFQFTKVSWFTYSFCHEDNSINVIQCQNLDVDLNKQ